MTIVGKQSPQQAAVYRAEAKCSRGETFVTTEQAQKYVWSLQASDWWNDRYGVTTGYKAIEVGGQQGNWSIGDSEQAVIALTHHGRCEQTALHEVAHVIAGNAAGHTGPWVRVYLELTYLVRGAEAWIELQDALIAENADLG